ncbi:MAG: hypothetical protein Q8R76_00480 [Candidatus Omnitrophota bacterium]|nr:hypothetical protein [Candidatus Omnitrophota bacterium]
MTFEELLAAMKKIKCDEMRKGEAGYLEMVITKSEMAPMTSVLQSYFGEPLKPEGQAPSGDANQVSKPYGGIRRDQTMYHHKSEANTEVALLWPWGNGTSITVKVIRE